jgi:RNA polymerase sigma-70 factor (ECF subfamily)
VGDFLTLATSYAASLPAGVGAPPGDLEAALRAFHEAGRAAWPTLEVEPAALCRWLAERAGQEATLPDLSLAPDAYLACSCVLDAPGAVVAFDRAFAPMMDSALSRVDRSPAFAEDAAQAVREKLFVAPPGVPPKIAEYACRAPLRAWLRVVAVRAALNLRRRRASEPYDTIDTRDERLVAGTDPELRLAKARHKAALEDAIRAAIERLSPKERALLRLHLVEGSSIDVLAAHYHVGRSTAARWLAAAREALREHTRAEMSARLGSSDPASVAAFVRSQLELSVLGLFGRAGEG